MIQNYLEDPAHNDFTEIQGDTAQLLELRKEMIDMVNYNYLNKLNYYIVATQLLSYNLRGMTSTSVTRFVFCFRLLTTSARM